MALTRTLASKLREAPATIGNDDDMVVISALTPIALTSFTQTSSLVLAPLTTTSATIAVLAPTPSVVASSQ